MKPLVIVDFSHLFSRNLFVAINQAKPRIKNGKYLTEDIRPYLSHLLFNSLQFIKNKFGGETLLALDSRNNWRKDFYEDYKGTRAKGKEDSEIKWKEIYETIEEIVQVIKENFPFKVIRVEKTEADDIGGVLAQKYGNDREVILVTSDHDWLQNITHGKHIKMYDPIKQEYSNLSEWEHEIINTPVGEMSRFTAMHTLLGDSGDNIPNITHETKFSDSFITHLKENDIYSDNVTEVKNMHVFEEIVEKYKTLSIVKSGKRKGLPQIDYRIWYRIIEEDLLIKKDDFHKLYDSESVEYEIVDVYVKDIYKKVTFGPKKAEKALASEESLLELINSHYKYLENFKFSNTLVDFDKIPEELKNKIIDEYKKVKVNYNQNGMLEYFVNEGLGKMVNQITKFYDSSYEVINNSSLDDFF